MTPITLVTGGAGFIGSHLVETLAGLGRPVRVLDNFSTGQRSNLAAIQPAPQLVEGDVTRPEMVLEAMHDVEVVFHLAAVASVQRSIEDPAGSHSVCATGTLNVLDAARRSGVKRFVYAASASAYGIPASSVQSEDTPVCPLSPYAAAKLAGELYAQAFAASYGVETVCLRFFNIFGPRQRADSPYSGVIALFVDAMLAGKRPRIFGDGLQTRDFTYVADVVQALLKAASVPRPAERVYNVGTGRRVTLLDLVAVLNRLLGTQLEPEHGPTRAGDIRHSCADITRIRRDLHYEPGTTFEEGVERILHWYRQQSR
jgi:UDP-glucose 4-epimerase